MRESRVLTHAEVPRMQSCMHVRFLSQCIYCVNKKNSGSECWKLRKRCNYIRFLAASAPRYLGKYTTKYTRYSGRNKNNQRIMKFEELIEKLHVLFAEKEVNIDVVKHAMESYKSNVADWEKYAHFTPHRYTRNLVDRGNGKFNLILLCWSEGQGSGVHDHSDSHCFMKMLEGQLKETLYAWPQDPNVEEPLAVTGTSIYKNNEVTYINDQIGLHRVENESHSNRSASLHLYSPPFDMAQSFDQRTGHAFQCQVTFYSENGKINN